MSEKVKNEITASYDIGGYKGVLTAKDELEALDKIREMLLSSMLISKGVEVIDAPEKFKTVVETEELVISKFKQKEMTDLEAHYKRAEEYYRYRDAGKQPPIIGQAIVRGERKNVEVIDPTFLKTEGVMRVVFRDKQNRMVTAFIPPSDVVKEKDDFLNKEND